MESGGQPNRRPSPAKGSQGGERTLWRTRPRWRPRLTVINLDGLTKFPPQRSNPRGRRDETAEPTTHPDPRDRPPRVTGWKGPSSSFRGCGPRSRLAGLTEEYRDVHPDRRIASVDHPVRARATHTCSGPPLFAPGEGWALSSNWGSMAIWYAQDQQFGVDPAMLLNAYPATDPRPATALGSRHALQ